MARQNLICMGSGDEDAASLGLSQFRPFLDAISPWVAFNNHSGSTKSYDCARAQRALNRIDFIESREKISTQYDPGTLTTVEQHDGSLLRLRKLGAGMTPEAILADNPRLTLEDIRAAQAFAADYLADTELDCGLALSGREARSSASEIERSGLWLRLLDG